MKHLWVFLALVTAFQFSISQTVHMYAGPAIGIDDALIQDSTGRLYGSGYDSGTIYTVAPGGATSILASGFGAANGLAWDHLGNLIVCDNIGDTIYRITPDTTITAIVGINSPSGIIKDPLSDTLYITQYIGDKIWKLTPDDSLILFAQGNGLNGPVGLVWDQFDRLLVSNFDNQQVMRFERDGSMTVIGSFAFSGPVGFIQYDGTYIYGTSFNSHKIYRMDTLGNTEWVAGTYAGTVNGPADTARFSRPNGILFSAGGDSLFISDYGSKSVRLITGLDSIGLVGLEPGLVPAPELRVYPQPITSEARLVFDLQDASAVELRWFDLQGRLVRQQPLGHLPAGQQEFLLDASGLPSGMYLLEATGPAIRSTLRVVVQSPGE